MNDLRVGDCRNHFPELEENSHVGIVTDPPYELLQKSRKGSARRDDRDKPFGRHGSQGRGFMGMKWDATGVPFQKETWEAALRVVRPGGYLLAFGGTRTWHRLAVAIEDAGWEIKDSLYWLYAEGMPKGKDIPKAILKSFDDAELAAEFEGYESALKPAVEPIVVAMKPLQSTYAENARTWRQAGLNIEACRIPFAGARDEFLAKQKNQHEDFDSLPKQNLIYDKDERPRENWSPVGRFPSNLIHDGSPEVVKAFQRFGKTTSSGGRIGNADGAYSNLGSSGFGTAYEKGNPDYGDVGFPDRFFYCAKASTDERERGLLGHLPCVECQSLTSTAHQTKKGRWTACRRNDHPTVKPLSLCEYLVKLIMPPGKGKILDPFMGSGRTGMACTLLDCDFTGFELEPSSFNLSQLSIAWAESQAVQLDLFGT